MEMCYVSGVTVYDRRTSELFNAPLYMKEDAYSIEL